jgi:hypothetical protein
MPKKGTADVEVKLHVFLTSELYELNSLLHTPSAVPTGKKTLVLNGQETGWTPEKI